MSEVTREYYKENEVREAMWLAQEYGFDILKTAFEYAAQKEKDKEMTDECFVDFVLEPETESRVVICTIEASALVVHNEPSHSDDLDFAISGYYIRGYRWEEDGIVHDDKYVPLPKWVIDVCVEHEKSIIIPQLSENLTKQLEIGPRPYESAPIGHGLCAGRVE